MVVAQLVECGASPKSGRSAKVAGSSPVHHGWYVRRNEMLGELLEDLVVLAAVVGVGAILLAILVVLACGLYLSVF